MSTEVAPHFVFLPNILLVSIKMFQGQGRLDNCTIIILSCSVGSIVRVLFFLPTEVILRVSEKRPMDILGVHFTLSLCFHSKKGFQIPVENGYRSQNFVHNIVGHSCLKHGSNSERQFKQP